MTPVAVIGAGPAGLMAAEALAEAGAAVVVYDHMPSPARKLLIAGRGGLNLTHSEPLDAFLARYGAARTVLEPAIRAFPPDALCAWADALGAETFVGSSGRVFPRAMKASPLLRAWLARLAGLGVTLRQRHRWLGFDGPALRFATPAGETRVTPAATVLALGGASWPRLGSDGGWTALMPGVPLAPLRPANMGFRVDWSAHMQRHAGAPLKRIALRFRDTVVRGECVLAAAGIEGGAVYALSAPLRDALANGPATLHIDLRPDLDEAALAQRLGGRGESVANRLRRAGLAPPAAALVQEVLHAGAPGANPVSVRRSGKRQAGSWQVSGRLAHAAGQSIGADQALAALVKAVPVTLRAAMPLARAISSAGGVALQGLDARFMLRALPGVFACGEMLDWEAPTGGYLLQACFATGRAAAQGTLAYMQEKNPAARLRERGGRATGPR